MFLVSFQSYIMILLGNFMIFLSYLHFDRHDIDARLGGGNKIYEIIMCSTF